MSQRTRSHLFLLAAVFIFALVAAPALAGGPQIVGSWEVETVFDGTGASESILETYGQRGTLITSGSTAGAGNGHGAWEKTGPRTYSTSQVIFGFAPDGSLAAVVRANAEIEVSQDGQSYVGTFEADVEVVGGPTLSNSGTVTGSRIDVD